MMFSMGRVGISPESCSPSDPAYGKKANFTQSRRTKRATVPLKDTASDGKPDRAGLLSLISDDGEMLPRKPLPIPVEVK
jgi:hypothetical protein